MKRFDITKENFNSYLCREIQKYYGGDEMILNIKYESDFVEISTFSIKFKKSFLNPEEQKSTKEDDYFTGEDEFTKLVWIDEHQNESWETRLELWRGLRFNIVSIKKPFNDIWIEIYVNR